MVFFQGKLYAIDVSNEDFLAINIVDDDDNGNPRVSRIERIIEGAPLPYCQYSYQMPSYLIESHGTLLMIRRKISYTFKRVVEGKSCILAGNIEYEVLEADFGRLLWAEVRSLGNDLALFLGRGCSRAVCVSPYDLSRDCIFFVDDYTDTCWKKRTTSCSVYDMKDGKVYSSLPMVSWKSGNIPATWLFSQGKTDKLQTTGEHLQEIVEGLVMLVLLLLRSLY